MLIDRKAVIEAIVFLTNRTEDEVAAYLLKQQRLQGLSEVDLLRKFYVPTSKTGKLLAAREKELALA